MKTIEVNQDELAKYNRHKYSFEEIVSMYKNKGHQARLREIHS